MSDETNITTPPEDTHPEDSGAQTGKTFTQEEVNRIVSDRLTREREKGRPDPLTEREQELAKRELLLTARETLVQKGLPTDLLDALNTSSPEAFQRSLDLFEIHAKERARQIPPPYAAGTGSSPMYGKPPDDAIRGAFRPKI